MSLSWLPNALTIARCLLAGWVGWLILTLPTQSIWPFAAFVIVAASDFLDGWTARRLDAITPFGAFLDPIADKLLVGISLIAITLLQDQAWLILIPTVAIIARDVIATVIRVFPKVEMPVSQLAKWKTALEMIAIGCLLLAGPLSLSLIFSVGLILAWGAAALSVYTLGLYVGALLVNEKRPR